MYISKRAQRSISDKVNGLISAFTVKHNPHLNLE